MNALVITATHNPKIYEANLGKSDLVKLIDHGSKNVAKSYNKLTRFAKGFSQPADTLIYAHHDVLLPGSFETMLRKALEKLAGENWGVIGVAGVSAGRKQHGYISDRGHTWGSAYNLPHEVETLDELLLVTKGDFVFDENLPFDFYGADICMQARERNRKCFAVNAYCEHNSSRAIGGRTPEFYTAEEYFKNKWPQYLPIPTTCCIVS